MKNIKKKRLATMSLSAMMILGIASPLSLSVETVRALEENNKTNNSIVTKIENSETDSKQATSYKEGVTIKENTKFTNTDSKYMATFTYVADKDLEKVTVTGGFGFFTSEAAKDYLNNGSTGTITPVSPENFKNDGSMFTTGHLVSPGGYVEIEMTEISNRVWSVDVPLPNGQYYYKYNLYSNAQGRYDEQILDPANLPLTVGNNSSGWSLFYIGDKENCLDGQEYTFPTDVKKGEVNYMTYTAVDGSQQAMGVYLPHGYNKNKTYKTLYLSHGSGGNEVEWFEIGSAKNIMDNLIAAGEVEDTVVVTLDLTTTFRLGNSAPGRGFETIEDNIMNYVIPYVESHYSVSTNAKDRAFAGLSGGARLTTFLYQKHAGEFGYFGMFSHTLSGIDVENIENKDYPTLMLGYGNLDPFGKTNFPDFTSRLDKAGVKYDLYDVNGGHDWGAWRTLLSIFVKDYLWEDTNKPVNPGEEGTAESAVRSVIIPRYEKDGTKTEQHISDTLKSHLSIKNIKQEKNEIDKTITVDVQLKDVNLVSNYKNCVDEPGTSYYNMLSYYINVLQVKELVDKNEGYSIIDSKGNTVDAAYVNELVGLLKQINDFDPTTDLQYDWDSAYDTDAFKNETTRGATDVIAKSKEGNVILRFHIDSHGWWGYDLGAHDSITGLVMGYDADEAYDKQHDLTMDYGNFFVIKMKEDKNGTWYMLNDTDLQNPMMYVSKDGKEAFMIDVDFYGANVLNEKIKAVIGDKCESLKIFVTHNHGDHANNLAVIGQDDELRNITTIVWPENESHTVLTEKDGTVESMVGKDLISDIQWKSVETVKDMEKFTAAGVEFQFLEITDEHTPGGGQLADLTHKVIYSGDSLGAQIQYGGTNFNMSNAHNWLLGAQKAEKYIKENNIKYNIGGHTPYLNNPEYGTWVATAIQSAYDQLSKDPKWAGGTIVVENGKVVSNERMMELQSKGMTDREVLTVCSITFRNNLNNEYDVVEGKNSSWKKGTDDNVKITVNVEKDKYTTVLIDNNVVDTSNYQLSEDGTTIEFTKEYLNSLAEDKHSVLLQYSDGVAIATLNIEAADANQPTTPDQPENPSDTEKPSTPANGGQTTTDKPTVKPTTDTTTKVNKPTSSKVKTGDDTELLGLVSMMVLAGGTVCLVKRKKEVE